MSAKHKKSYPVTPPHDQTTKTIKPEDTTANKGEGRPNQPPLVPEIPPSPGNAPNPSQCQHNSTPWWEVVLEVTAVLIGLAYTIFACVQWRALLDSNKINRASLVVVQRAFVYMPELHIEKSMKNNKLIGLTFYAQWENTGNTTAIHALVRQNSDWRPQQLPKDFDYPDKQDGQMFQVELPRNTGHTPIFIAPHSKVMGGPLLISCEQLEAVNKGTRSLTA